MTTRGRFALGLRSFTPVAKCLSEVSADLGHRFMRRMALQIWLFVGVVAAFSASAAAQHKYDASLGTLPQNQGVHL
jgi:hypothetical protein